jgi:hypothetical protein
VPPKKKDYSNENKLVITGIGGTAVQDRVGFPGASSGPTVMNMTCISFIGGASPLAQKI